MERRYQVRLKELLGDAVVRPEQLQGMLERLERFVEPYAACLVRQKQRTLTQQYVAGLVSQIEHKNVESIAYHHDQDRQALQKFIGQYTWDHRPLLTKLVEQVAGAIGREDGVLVFDPSSFEKQGPESVGVKYQWCGRRQAVANCQVGYTWRTPRPRNRRWSTSGCICPKSGRARKPVVASAACLAMRSFKRGRNWLWKCSMNIVGAAASLGGRG